jgi:hypothetical protein
MLFESSTKTITFRHPRMLLSGPQRLNTSEQRRWIPACAETTTNNFFLHNQKQQPSTKTQGDTP